MFPICNFKFSLSLVTAKAIQKIVPLRDSKKFYFRKKLFNYLASFTL